MPRGERNYDETLADLLGLIGRPVAVFVNTSSKFEIAILEGVLERGSESLKLQELHRQTGAPELGDHVVFQVGESSYFLIIRDEFIETVVSKTGGLVLQFHEYEIFVFDRS